MLGADNAAASFCPPKNLGKSSCTVLEHEYDLSQAAGAGASCEEPELSQALGAGPGESSLYTEEPDEIDMSQPVVAAPPKALFSLVGGAAASFNGLPPLIFELPAEQGVRMRFGRRLPAAGASFDDTPIIYITERSDLGISRANGHVEFDESRGVILHRLVREGFPTFHQGKLMVAESIQLAHDDTIGFGSTSDPNVPSAGTITYHVDLSPGWVASRCPTPSACRPRRPRSLARIQAIPPLLPPPRAHLWSRAAARRAPRLATSAAAVSGGGAIARSRARRGTRRTPRRRERAQLPSRLRTRRGVSALDSLQG